MIKENAIIFLIFLAILLSCFSVSAQTSNGSLELTCRSQAKDVAVTTYNNCMTDGRNKHIEAIRGEYQQKLKELKSHYDNELKKIDTGNTSGAPSSSIQQAPKQEPTIQLQPNTKGRKQASPLRSNSSARRARPQTLPQKTVRSQSPVYSAPQEVVVAPSANPYEQGERVYEESSPYSEKESAEAGVDVIDLPAQE